MLAVFKREFLSYFRTPVGYVALALFSFLSGLQFVNQLSSASATVNISNEILALTSFFVVIVPIITMGLFSEDKKRGTEILYYTSPVSILSVVVGKFLAAMALLGIMFCNIFVHMIITASLSGVIDIGTWGSVIIFFCVAAVFISIGILASAITDNQIIAAILSLVIILVIQMIKTISVYASSGVKSLLVNLFSMDPESVTAACSKVENGIVWLSPITKLQDFRAGIFSIAPIVFCITSTFVFLFITYRVLEKKRWSQN